MEATQIDLYIAERVRECLTSANYGKYPVQVDEWREVAARLGVHLACVPFDIGGAFILDDLLLHETGDADTLARYFAHELAESRLRCECEAPYIHPAFDGAFHRIACLVEHPPGRCLLPALP